MNDPGDSSLEQRMLERLVYDPEEGIVYWSEDSRNKFPGGVAGALNFMGPNRDGYWVIMFENKVYRRARVAYLLMTNEWPDCVDHENGVTDDDRWENLRKATRSENMRNQKLRVDNTSGSRGVSRFRNKWHARVHVEGVTHHIGYFETFEEAKAARDLAAERLHGEFAKKDIAS